MSEIHHEGRDGRDGDEFHDGDESGQYEDEEILNTWLGELNTLKKVSLVYNCFPINTFNKDRYYISPKVAQQLCILMWKNHCKRLH